MVMRNCQFLVCNGSKFQNKDSSNLNIDELGEACSGAKCQCPLVIFGVKDAKISGNHFRFSRSC